MFMTDGLKPSDRARIGTQGFLIITAVPAAAPQTLLGKRLLDVGLLGVAGTYECDLDVQGLTSVDVSMMPSAIVGVITPIVASRYANRVKARTVSTPAGGAFAAAALQTMTVALKGEKVVKVSFTIPGASSITFDPTAGAADPQGATPAAHAEYNGK